MPYKPKRPCRVQGCRGFAEPGEQYCEKHRLQLMREYNQFQRDTDTQEFYNSGAWRKTSKAKLRCDPLCEECLKKRLIRPAVLVDHIVPIKQGGARLDPRNLQSLCNACHEKKSIEEGSRFGGGRGI